MSGYRVDERMGASRPQLQIWDDEARETAIGVFEESGVRWSLVVIVEPIAGDLVRGRLSFRSGEERYDTAPVLLEETAARVVQRAVELPRALVRQLFLSARG
ncbi:MAG: hypothetical protein ACRELC_09630 [Gemmatimonadota bacterium]